MLSLGPKNSTGTSRPKSFSSHYSTRSESLDCQFYLPSQHMTKAKLTVTVAILAYNEERYISGLIQSIYAQTRSNFKLDRISLYYDGGTDSTVAKVERHFPQVTIHSFKTNRGKSFRINQLVGQNTSDILIQLDADVLLKDTSVFSRLVAPFYSHRRPGIVCAYHRALPDRSLISRIAFFGYRVWDRSRTSLGQRGTRYYCEGGLRAFSRQFTDVFRIPLHRHIGEDTYSFLFAVSHGFRVSVAKQA